MIGAGARQAGPYLFLVVTMSLQANRTDNRISATALRRFVESNFGPVRKITRLDGEFDMNFRVHADGRDFLLKFTNAANGQDRIDSVISAMRRLAESGIGAITPRPIVMSDGCYTKHFDALGGEMIGWAMSIVPGRPLESIDVWHAYQAVDVGHCLANFAHALADLTVAEPTEARKWHILCADWITEPASNSWPAHKRSLIDAVSGRYIAETKPLVEAMPSSVIHGDANPMNLFFAEEQGRWVLSGLIDFGDMSVSPRIADPAIAASYLMRRTDDPVAAAEALLASFHRVLPLSRGEIEIFLELIRLRLACTVVNATRNRVAGEDDDYLFYGEAPAWRLLEFLSATDARVFADRMLHSCEAVAAVQ